MDDLVLTLLGKVADYFSVVYNLKAAGRIPVSKQSIITEGKQAAERLPSKGF